ncbi:nicotinate phosphoribosyltransferase [Thermodesulforhabdus norvegica]|uniref:Nicotinate phosphoribosyltransferase n=1 Tax=Thermodesulforhabdus norvegica TaxID=39841 RepID=A0A1I4UN22_9BACT|nr:nicotinate phosphoribosyltransferase [Thermodesulforhabdus norvegica]SFM90404.1 nicotinate phosphoribosyltransferase [Thermodesulforhabdus norvegica]
MSYIGRLYDPVLATDLYELTMAASYFREGKKGIATFSLHIRDYPPNRAYFVAAGLASFLEILGDFRFSGDAIDYLRSLGKFDEDFLSYLKSFRFTGSVRALPEGTIFFAQEPLVEITAPIIEGQILETIVMNTFHVETLIASKAARCVAAAGGRGLVDFSLRRTHGIDAGVKTARSSYLVGFLGTSNVLAGRLYGIPVFGTMAHSYITSFDREIDAFMAYARSFPENTVLLLDTYDTLKAAEKAVEVARYLENRGYRLRGVRLDSGDLVELSRRVKDIFVKNGMDYVSIMASGSLDEFALEELIKSGAHIDAVGIGTKLGVSADAPYLDLAYKLVEYEGKPILKLSPGKRTWVGRKQVYRYFDGRGQMSHDVLTLMEDKREGMPLLRDVVINGQILHNPTLDEARANFAEQFSSLPEEYRSIRPDVKYRVEIGEPLLRLEERVAREKLRDQLRG